MILTMLSGGIDSVSMVYTLLKEGKELHIHHIEIENDEHRSRAETVAVNKVLTYLRSVGLDNFAYTSSKIECPTVNGKFLFDSDAINFFAGFLCDANPKIKQVAVGANKEDSRNVGSDRILRASKLLSLFTDVEKIYPIKDYSKKELYDNLPQGLKDVFWSCRTPVYEDNYAKPCYSCFTCGQMKTMGIIQQTLYLLS